MASEHNDPVGKLMLQIGRDAARCVDLERDVAELVAALEEIFRDAEHALSDPYDAELRSTLHQIRIDARALVAKHKGGA